MIPKIAVSIGEPAGIGSDQIIMLCQELEHNNLIAFCDPNLLIQRSQQLNLNINIINITFDDLKNPSLPLLAKKNIYVIKALNHHYHADYNPGKLDQNTACDTLQYLKLATQACLDNYCHALVTCPIQKSLITSILPNFYGHTEFLEELCNNYYQKQNNIKNNFKSVMMLMNNKLKTALVTTHIPLAKVPTSITTERIIQIAKIINQDLITKFGIERPNILITGLNPHAGEDGKLGSEEKESIIPAIEYLKSTNIQASGPYAADSIYSRQDLQPSDIILAMYHDQGLTGFKARTFNTAANVTLGLPIIRTSVDHGTALNLAGTGNINISSLKYAINIAKELASNSLNLNEKRKISS